MDHDKRWAMTSLDCKILVSFVNKIMRFLSPTFPASLLSWALPCCWLLTWWHNQSWPRPYLRPVILFALFIQTINYWLALAPLGPWQRRHYLRLADISVIIPGADTILALIVSDTLSSCIVIVWQPRSVVMVRTSSSLSSCNVTMMSPMSRSSHLQRSQSNKFQM